MTTYRISRREKFLAVAVLAVLLFYLPIGPALLESVLDLGANGTLRAGCRDLDHCSREDSPNPLRRTTRVWSYKGQLLSGSGVTVQNLPGVYLGLSSRAKREKSADLLPQ